MPDGEIKKVGNSIKSRKNAGFLEAFLDKGIDLLLHGQGYEFLNEYYGYVERIYNYQIPIKDIASKGNIKKTIAEYKEDCKKKTKSGSKKSRQAWYEIAIKEGLNPNVGDSIYYVNTGTKKGHSDVKRITRIYAFDENGEKKEVTKEVEKEYKLRRKEDKTLNDRMKVAIDLFGPKVFEEDEITLNCKMVPQEIMDSDEDIFCCDVEGIEYNVDKYIDQFNKRVKILLVCFDKSIRGDILVSNPKERKYFTEEQAKLVSGQPNKEGDQDSYEELMTPNKREMAFWDNVGEVPPYVDECDIKWDELFKEYKDEVERENNKIYKVENRKYLEALDNLSKEELEEFEEEGKIPASLTSIVTLKDDLKFYFNALPSLTPSTGGYIFDDIKLEDIDTSY